MQKYLNIPLITSSIIYILVCALCLSIPVYAQDQNILHSIADIEQRLMYEPFEIFKLRPSRFQGDITKRLIVIWSDDIRMQLKLKKAPRGGSKVNNQPRYEVAAYKIQKLILDPENYVVPPTVARCFDLQNYQQFFEPEASPTFKNSPSVFCVLQYWLENVTSNNIYDKKLFEANESYARNLGNLNIVSYLIRHNDSNKGNFLISTDMSNLRVFAVDNGLAFNSAESDRGVEWRRIKVKKLPLVTIDRLRKIQMEDLTKTLGVVAQFEIKGGLMAPVEATETINKKKGVRTTDSIVQFGLTEKEIKDVYKRLERLLKRIDSNKIETF